MPEAAILKTLERRGPCTVDAIINALPDYSHDQVIAVIDRLKEDGRLLFCAQTDFEKVISNRPIWQRPD
jgi:hypothetical protein